MRQPVGAAPTLRDVNKQWTLASASQHSKRTSSSARRSPHPHLVEDGEAGSSTPDDLMEDGEAGSSTPDDLIEDGEVGSSTPDDLIEEELRRHQGQEPQESSVKVS